MEKEPYVDKYRLLLDMLSLLEVEDRPIDCVLDC